MKTSIAATSIAAALACAGIATADSGTIVTTNRTVQSVASYEFEVALCTDTLVYRKANGRWRVDWNATVASYEKMAETNDSREDFQMWTFLTTDCNENGIPDAKEIAGGAPDIDHDGVIDACEYAVGDLNLSGQIDQQDVYILLGWWGSAAPVYGDLNLDGKVDGYDLGIMLGRFALVIF